MSKVKMWLALDENESEINIENAELKKEYKCISCGKTVKARAKESNLVTEHFYHVEPCECNGESAIHKYWKDNLIHIGDKINIPTIGEVVCVDKKIEYSFKLNEKDVYRPDLIIKTDNEQYKYIIFEIYNTNRKNYTEYKRKWVELGYCVIEIDVSKLDRNKTKLKESINILYDKAKEEFYYNCGNEIRMLYSTLELFKSVDFSKLNYSHYKEETFQESLDRSQKILGKFYRIFKKGCYDRSRINLDILRKELNYNSFDNNIRRTIIDPLYPMLDKLYIYN